MTKKTEKEETLKEKIIRIFTGEYERVICDELVEIIKGKIPLALNVPERKELVSLVEWCRNISYYSWLNLPWEITVLEPAESFVESGMGALKKLAHTYQYNKNDSFSAYVRSFFRFRLKSIKRNLWKQIPQDNSISEGIEKDREEVLFTEAVIKANGEIASIERISKLTCIDEQTVRSILTGIKPRMRRVDIDNDHVQLGYYDQPDTLDDKIANSQEQSKATEALWECCRKLPAYHRHIFYIRCSGVDTVCVSETEKMARDLDPDVFRMTVKDLAAACGETQAAVERHWKTIRKKLSNCITGIMGETWRPGHTH